MEGRRGEKTEGETKIREKKKGKAVRPQKFSKVGAYACGKTINGVIFTTNRDAEALWLGGVMVRTLDL